MPIFYRSPVAADVEALAALGRETFCDTFAHLYAAEDLTAFLEQAYSVPSVQADFDNPRLYYQVAEDNGQLVGYCKIGDGVTLDYDPQGRRVVELKQLYLRADYFGQAVAGRLMDWALEKAAALNADDMLLSVFSENPRAQRFYQKYGFAHVADTIFMVGNHEDHEFLYLKKLK
ncbi:GNAT family N-acetyltransferase [Sphingorhabdus arenilitoris]|uniref:GNAT family N-acetyltransferase n=1 Tax=Sphingorhabdus arenilitoris TaxID=1490041 RepID=A0ABV8RFA6_9SPHN